MADALLQIEGLEQTLRRRGGIRCHSPRRAGRRAACRHRSERCRQDHAVGQLAGEIVPDAGRIHFAGADVTPLPTDRRSRLGLARSFQITSLFLDFTALDNVALGCRRMPVIPSISACRAQRARPARAGAPPRSPASASPAAPTCRSPSQPRRASQLEIAMALATSPRMLLLDEPMAGMDRRRSARMVTALRELKRELTILLIEHDVMLVSFRRPYHRPGLWPHHRVRSPRGDPCQRGRAAGLSRRARAGPCLTRPCSSLTASDQLRAEQGPVRHLVAIAPGEMVTLMGQRHGQDHDRSLDHGAYAGDGGLHPVRRPADPRPAGLSRGEARRTGAGGSAGFPT